MNFLNSSNVILYKGFFLTLIGLKLGNYISFLILLELSNEVEGYLTVWDNRGEDYFSFVFSLSDSEGKEHKRSYSTHHASSRYCYISFSFLYFSFLY